jgi:hypothetical protein
VAQQVPQRAAGLTDGLFEGDDAFLDSDQTRPRRDRLGN